MYRKMLRAKIHRATITHADVDYEGSLTIPPDLMEAADIREHEAVCVWNVTSGTRYETYAIAGAPGSRDLCSNGAAAHLTNPGDLVIISCFTQVLEEKLSEHHPIVIFVDSDNRALPNRKEIPGPLRAAANLY